MRRYTLPPINLTGPEHIPNSAYRNLCSNAQHPKGGWHEAVAKPGTWQWVEHFRQWRRFRKWGCWCP